MERQSQSVIFLLQSRVLKISLGRDEEADRDPRIFRPNKKKICLKIKMQLFAWKKALLKRKSTEIKTHSELRNIWKERLIAKYGDLKFLCFFSRLLVLMMRAIGTFCHSCSVKMSRVWLHYTEWSPPSILSAFRARCNKTYEMVQVYHRREFKRGTFLQYVMQADIILMHQQRSALFYKLVIFINTV